MDNKYRDWKNLVQIQEEAQLKVTNPGESPLKIHFGNKMEMHGILCPYHQALHLVIMKILRHHSWGMMLAKLSLII